MTQTVEMKGKESDKQIREKLEVHPVFETHRNRTCTECIHQNKLERYAYKNETKVWHGKSKVTGIAEKKMERYGDITKKVKSVQDF